MPLCDSGVLSGQSFEPCIWEASGKASTQSSLPSAQAAGQRPVSGNLPSAQPATLQQGSHSRSAGGPTDKQAMDTASATAVQAAQLRCQQRTSPEQRNVAASLLDPGLSSARRQRQAVGQDMSVVAPQKEADPCSSMQAKAPVLTEAQVVNDIATEHAANQQPRQAAQQAGSARRSGSKQTEPPEGVLRKQKSTAGAGQKPGLAADKVLAERNVAANQAGLQEAGQGKKRLLSKNAAAAELARQQSSKRAAPMKASGWDSDSDMESV